MPSNDWTLAFDTSAAHVAAALFLGGQLVGKTVEAMAKGQAESLFPILEKLLHENGIGFGDLTRIGVGVGPGNFTGIRISVAAARGLALSLNIPAIGVNNFEATALGHARPVTVEISAPRDNAYFQTLTAAGSAAPTMGTKSSDGTLPLAPIETLIENIALIALGRADKAAPVPLYIKPADAAPSKDKPVVHL